MVLSKTCRVWRKNKPCSILLESKDVPDHALLFESDVIAVLDPAEVDILRKDISYTGCIGAYGTLGVLVLQHEESIVKYLVLVTGCQSMGKIKDTEIFKLTQATFIPLSTKALMELVLDVGKLLASGKFFFGHPSFGAEFDLLSCAQKQGTEQPHFYWNKGLLAYMQRFGVDTSQWLFRTMCGHVDIHTVYAGEKQAKLCLFSRVSCERAGTRFNVRGINDDGHVANFVETEEAIYVDDSVASYIQIRGLVPLFWDQPGLQTGGGMTKIKFSRGYSCSHPAFERHFEWCLLHYGPTLCLNLLGSHDWERMLTAAFLEHFTHLSTTYCAELACFDYHRICKSGGNLDATLTQSLMPGIQDIIKTHGYYVCTNGHPVKNQTATIRTNCLDCLDRTNSVQGFLGRRNLPLLMGSLGLSSKESLLSRFKQILSSSWTRNGDSLSRLYTGTRALKFEGKSKLKDGARSVQRTIRNNFMDSTKQEAIDVLLLSNECCGELGLRSKALLDKTDQLGPIPFKQMMCDRWKDYANPKKLRVAVGTWNVNGGTRIRSIALRNQSLSDWLLDGPTITGAVKDHPEEFRSPPDVYAIGFEELVGLTAGNIVSASSSNRKEWGAELQKVLSQYQPYELLTAEQLVGICLYIFVQPKLIPYIRDVAVRSVKTGMSGKAGNKGGVAIRFLLHSTSFCFMCSHFAAHQTKVLERNQDYTDICRKISFPHGQAMDSHDYIFWCGDLNYRIELPTTLAKDYISHSRWDKLYKQDQLFRQRKLNKVFQGYIEGELNFAPTYKYDEFSDDYDTSDKCRTPAWCDRVLWMRKRRQSGLHKKVALPLHHTNVPLYYTIGSDEACPHDFGPHPSDAWQVCQQVMEAEEEGKDTHPSHYWHPGRLIYYNRAELKQSDHRPVLAIIEVDVFQVEPSKRLAVREEVLKELGPTDPTIVVEEKGGECKLSLPCIFDLLNPFGEIVLVRVTETLTLVTFSESQSAMAATSLQGHEVNDVTLEVTLYSSWPSNPSVHQSRGEASPKDHLMTLSMMTGAKLKKNSKDDIEDDEEEPVMEFTFQADDDSGVKEVVEVGEYGGRVENDGESEGTKGARLRSPQPPHRHQQHFDKEGIVPIPRQKSCSTASMMSRGNHIKPATSLSSSFSSQSELCRSPSPLRGQDKPGGAMRVPPSRPAPPRPSLPPSIRTLTPTICYNSETELQAAATTVQPAVEASECKPIPRTRTKLRKAVDEVVMSSDYDDLSASLDDVKLDSEEDAAQNLPPRPTCPPRPIPRTRS